MTHHIPDKPDKQKEQISSLWDAVYNHIPTQLRWLNVKINFIVIMIGLTLALSAAIIVMVVN